MNPELLATVTQTLALPDDDIFALDRAAITALQARVARVVQEPRKPVTTGGVQPPLPELRAVAAPTRVNWRRRTTFPVLLGEVRGNRREWEVHALQNRALVVSNLDTGRVDVITPMDKGRRTPVLSPSGTGQRPDEFDAALSSISVRQYNLLDWFPRTVLQGNLAITFLDYDLASNTVLVHASGADATASQGASLRGPDRIPALAAQPRTGTAGVTLHAPSTITTKSATLHADVHLPRRRVTVIDSPPGSGPNAILIAATLVFVQIDRTSPILLHLAAPATPITNGDIDAAFTVELHSALNGRAKVGHWLVYLVIGDTVTGPHALDIQTP